MKKKIKVLLTILCVACVILALAWAIPMLIIGGLIALGWLHSWR